MPLASRPGQASRTFPWMQTVAAMALALLAPAQSAVARQGEIQFEPYQLVTYDGTAHAAEVGRFWVPESRRQAATAAGTDLTALFRRDLERLDKKPALLSIARGDAKPPVQLTVGADALRFVVAQMLPNGRAVTGLPALLAALDSGDDSLLSQQIAGLYSGFDRGITLMGRLMDCTALVSAGSRPGAIEAAVSDFGDVNGLHLRPAVCQEATAGFTLGREHTAPLFSTVPTLFLSGTLDSNTPPANAERMRWGFTKATHLVVENGFHETLTFEVIQQTVSDFFLGRDVAGKQLRLDPPHFLSVQEAKSQATAPPR